MLRNGLLPMNFHFLAEDSGAAGGEQGNETQSSNPGTEPGVGANEQSAQGGEDAKALLAQIEQLKADMAKQKTALDKAASEASDYKKQLRAKQTQEERDAASKKEAEEAAAARLAELEREVARAKSTKSVMAKLGVNEDAAGKIAECLTGCEDVDNALALIQNAWEAKEKALRLEFGKIPGPGAGGGSEDKEMQEALALAKELGQRRAQTASSVRDQLKGLVR